MHLSGSMYLTEHDAFKIETNYTRYGLHARALPTSYIPWDMLDFRTSKHFVVTPNSLNLRHGCNTTVQTSKGERVKGQLNFNL